LPLINSSRIGDALRARGKQRRQPVQTLLFHPSGEFFRPRPGYRVKLNSVRFDLLDPVRQFLDVGIGHVMPGQRKDLQPVLALNFSPKLNRVFHHPFDGLIRGAAQLAADVIVTVRLERDQVHAQGPPQTTRRDRAKNIRRHHFTSRALNKMAIGRRSLCRPPHAPGISHSQVRSQKPLPGRRRERPEERPILLRVLHQQRIRPIIGRGIDLECLRCGNVLRTLPLNSS